MVLDFPYNVSDNILFKQLYVLDYLLPRCVYLSESGITHVNLYGHFIT